MKKLVSMLLIIAAAISLTTCAERLPDPSPDYLALMVKAAASGDIDTGRALEAARNADSESAAADFVPVSFDELYLLSRYIEFRYGSYRCSDDLRFCAGELVLNRMASPEYPDELEAVILQPGELGDIDPAAFAACVQPQRRCVNIALRLLLGERQMESSVVIESTRPANDIYAMFCDRLLGNTYYYKSANAELYDQPGLEAPA